MPARNCETRPVSWRIHRNTALAEIVKTEGYQIWPMWIGFLTHRDNLGFFDGGSGTLKDAFFPHDSNITLEKIVSMKRALHDAGLIIIYNVDGIEYVLCPKISNFNKLTGNLSDQTTYPSPSKDVITAWEQRFNEVFTPIIRCTDDVRTPFKHRKDSVPTEGKGEGKGQDKGKSKDYTSTIEKFFFSIDPKWFKTLQAAYPKVNLTTEFEKMKAWLVSNPEKAKKNIKRFAVNWLSRNKPESSSGSAPAKFIITDKMLEDRLGKIATKPMIKKLMQEIPQTLWWKVDQYLRKRYKGSNGSSFAEAERELVAEVQEGKDHLARLTSGIGKTA